MLYNNIYAQEGGNMRKDEIINNDEICLAIYLKLSQLKRNKLDTLTYEHILSVLFYQKWNTSLPSSIHVAIKDIMELNAEEIVMSLHTLAMIQGAQTDVGKIEAILKGDYYV